jgi:RecA-family ATPase
LLGTSSLIAEVDDYIRDVCRQRFGRLAPAEIDPDDPFVGLEPRHGMSVEEIEGLIAKLDPDMSRDQWIRVGMALHHETEGDDTGFDIWDEWSSGGSKYVGEHDLRTQWNSFDRRAGSRRPNVTMSTVKAMAKDVLASPAVAEAVPYAGKYRVLSADEVARQPAPMWLIKGVLPDADVAIVYGAPGSGKSFLTFDMAAAVARGVDWFGRRVRRGRVVIIAAEGGGAYGKRVEAYCRANDIDAARLPVGIINARPNIMDADEIYELAAAIKASGGATLIQIDTLAQVTPGANENSGEDMGRALANAKALRDITGAMVMLLHHAGKDESRGARGWSGLLGAADMEMLVTRDAERNYREARITKQKDGEDGDRFAFRLGVVELGEDADGDPVSSCVVQAAETQQSAERSPDKKIKRRGQWQRYVLEVAASLDKSTATMPLTEFVAMALAAAPEHDRETLPRLETTLTRAVRSIARERDGPLGLDKNLVVFYE